MGYVSKDMLKRAREITALDYVLLCESSEYKRVGRTYRHKKYDALAVNEKGWYCHKTNKGGFTALDYLVELKGYGLVEAVCMLLGEAPIEPSTKIKGKVSKNNILNKTRNIIKSSSEQPQGISAVQQQRHTLNRDTSAQVPETAYSETTQSETPPPHTPLALPRRHKDNRRVIAYLRSRGIDKDLIVDSINRGVLYESAIHHHCVFLGKDEQNKTRFAAIRATTGRFMYDGPGSDKRYGFVIPPDNRESRTAAVFESPIDCLSHQTLSKQGSIPSFDGWRLSLGGTSTLALIHFLKQYPEITHCLICTDNDKYGNAAAEKITQEAGIKTERSPPLHGKDWNDSLVVEKQSVRLRHKCNAGEMTL